MTDFSASMLREKFVLREMDEDGRPLEKDPVIVTSNRFVLPLCTSDGREVERFVIRGHTMFNTCRMAARLLQTFEKSGPILVREIPFEWAEAWDQIVPEHEKKYNDKNWISVFSKGRPIYKTGGHTFLEVIEQCDIKNTSNYDQSVRTAEKAFQQVGKPFKIDHYSTVGLVTSVAKGSARCGLILRAPIRTTTFNFVANEMDTAEHRKISAARALSVSAAFLEGIHIGFFVGSVNEQLKAKIIKPYEPQAKNTELCRKRLGVLNAEIEQFEKEFDVRYRPERPNLFEIVEQAETRMADIIHQRRLQELEEKEAQG